jgi:thioredoxin-related protein
MSDSLTYFTKDALKKKSAVMLMIFNPDCEHCQHETSELIKHIDEFSKIQIVMATMMPFTSMISFREKYNLAQYDNIVVGQDIHYFLPSFYKISNLPFLAFYNKKKELISVFEGSMPIENALKELNK